MCWLRWRERAERYGLVTTAEITAAKWRLPSFLTGPRDQGGALGATTAARFASEPTRKFAKAPRAFLRANLTGNNASSSNRGRSMALDSLEISSGLRERKGGMFSVLRRNRERRKKRKGGKNWREKPLSSGERRHPRPTHPPNRSDQHMWLPHFESFVRDNGARNISRRGIALE